MSAIVLIGLSLSMDAFAVSISSGICIRDLKLFYAIRASLFFGLFQFIMPVIGWYFGETVESYINAYDHWIAFGLLVIIGGKMVKTGIQSIRRTRLRRGPEREAGAGSDAAVRLDREAAGENGESAADVRSLKTLLGLSLATSIDALAVGISLNILNHGLWRPAALIGGITLLVCLAGFEIGRRLRQGIGLVLEKWAQCAGGLVLIGLGFKILGEHLL
jgi:putative Mn2+ efflux pump MntP